MVRTQDRRVYTYPRPHLECSMAEAHQTSTPRQVQTESYAVFRDLGEPNLRFIGQIEVPRYSQPTADGVELSRAKRLSLAVARAVESDETFIENFMDPNVEQDDLSEIEGEEFLVLTEVGEDLEHVAYEQNPAFDGVWDPDQE